MAPRIEPFESPEPPPEQLAVLRSQLLRQFHEPIRLQVHDNRSTMISYRRNQTGLLIRIHQMFLPPPPDLADVLAAFVAGRGRRRAEAGHWLDRFIRDHRGAIRPPRSPPPPLSRGQVRDLQQIFDSLNQRYFSGAIQAQIGWGRAPSKRRRRSIKMGAYFHDSRHIRIHPALDQPQVPDYLVEFVVYHEMCHQACPPEMGSGAQKRIHTRAFRELERQHPDHARALAWEKRHLKLLLRSSAK
jgi:predicted SprT family Zn-dependent metalloprotease